MADADITIRLHEQRNIYVTLTPASGTLTISSATVTLYDSAGSVAGSVSAASATGITSGASAAPMAWFLLKPTVLALSAGCYELAFIVTDSSGIIYEPVVLVVVLGASY